MPEKMILTTPTQFVDVTGAQVPVYSVGAGPDVLFIHGWPMTANTYRFVLPELSKNFRCHLIDLPGSGKSRFDKDTPIDLLSHAQAVEPVAARLGLSDYGLVGHDSGGAIARYVAARDPNVRALVLAGTEIPGHHPLFIKRFQSAARLPGFEGIARFLFRSRGLIRSNFGFAGCFYQRGRIDHEFYELFVKPLVDSAALMYGAGELLRRLTPSMTDGLQDVHKGLKIPVHLVWGEEDPFFPVDLARKMASQFDDCTFTSVAKARLLVHEECPEAFNAAAMETFERAFSALAPRRRTEEEESKKDIGEVA